MNLEIRYELGLLPLEENETFTDEIPNYFDEDFYRLENDIGDIGCGQRDSTTKIKLFLEKIQTSEENAFSALLIFFSALDQSQKCSGTRLISPFRELKAVSKRAFKHRDNLFKEFSEFSLEQIQLFIESDEYRNVLATKQLHGMCEKRKCKNVILEQCNNVAPNNFYFHFVC